MPLVGWWKLQANAYDSGPNHLNGTNTGVSWSPTGITTAMCGFFDATDAEDRIRIDAVAPYISNNKAHSMFMWINTSTVASQALFAVNASNGGTNEMMLWTKVTTGKLDMYINNVGWQGEGTANVCDGVWHHVGYVFDPDAEEARVYVDGELDYTHGSEPNSGIETTNIVTLGADADSGPTFGDWFDGKMNDVRVYDHALSVQEIKHLASALVIHYKFGEDRTASTDQIIDSSDWGHHANFYNGDLPTWTNTSLARGPGAYSWATTTDHSIRSDATIYLNDWNSIACWVKGDKASMAAENIYPVGMALHGILGPSSAGAYRCGAITGNPYTYATWDYDIWDDTWHHNVITFNDTGINCFVDGEKKDSQINYDSGPERQSGLQFFYVGEFWSDTYGPLTGSVADVRYYQTELTESQVADIYGRTCSVDLGGNTWV